jgi:hypothetical protein
MTNASGRIEEAKRRVDQAVTIVSVLGWVLIVVVLLFAFVSPWFLLGLPALVLIQWRLHARMTAAREAMSQAIDDLPADGDDDEA